MPTEHNLNNYTFRETDSGVLEYEHDTEGLVWTYDPSSDTIIPQKEIDANSQDITNAGSVGTEGLDVEDRFSFPIENATDVLGSRSLGSWFTNNSDNTLYVAVDIDVDPGSGTDICRAIADMNNDEQSGNRFDQTTIVGEASTKGAGGPTILVPPGAHYRVRTFGNTSNASLSNWMEAELT